jgi:oligopeptide transport system substrate-binding protein
VNFLEVLHSESENNYAGYDNPEYDALLDRIRRTPDQQTRNRLMAEAEAMLNRDMPLLPLYFYTRSYLLKPFVKGFETQFLDNHLLKYLYFERG